MGSQTSSDLLFALLGLLCLRAVSKPEEASTKLYIVYKGERKHEDPNLVTASHHDLLTSLLRSGEEATSSIIYSYKHGFSGFAAMLTESQAEQLAESPHVISVKPSREYELQTTRSWNFLGLNYMRPSKLLHDSNFGNDVIIGIVDTGIWPESKSFNDKGYGPIPSRWKGKCELGEAFGPKNCSRKIIGARYYAAGVNEANIKADYLSPRDKIGHGTFTASVAAGSRVKGVSFHGLASGVARGGAPQARLAVYKAAWEAANGSSFGGSSATVLAAIDDAIHDGVDILSLSLGAQFGEEDFSFGALHAVARGITVVYAAGNTGPMPQTLLNTAPWVITVAATTIDRAFPTVITLGNNQSFIGQSIYYKSKEDSEISFKPLFNGGSCNMDSLNSTNIAGKVVLCFAIQDLPISLFLNVLSPVLKAGGKGLIFAQYTTNALDLTEECNGIPCVFVDFDIGNRITQYIASESSPAVTVEPTHNIVGKEVLSPKVAAFTSRGPSITFPEVLKPDIAAPGVSILAAMHDSYVLGSGTSAACPHVSGIVALLKSLHPDWSPAAMKSALVTTASVTNGYGMPIQAEGVPRKFADPFDYGGGHVDPNRAAEPGLIFDIDPKDYYRFFNCTLKPFEICGSELRPAYYMNLPSISVPNLKGPLTIWRTVTNVGKVDAVYKASLQSPPGVKMIIEPTILVFNATTRTNNFKVTFAPIHKMQGDYTFGSLTWCDYDAHSVRIPIAVRIIILDFYADTA